MRFSILSTAVATLALCGDAVQAAITPAEIVTNIQAVTTMSQALQGPAQSISLLNGPLIVVGLGPFPRIITGFAGIVSTTTTAIAQMQGTNPVTGAVEAKAIADAFREFVRVHQVLLNILIGKAGLFNTVPLIGQPVAAILRQVEAVVDTIAFGLIDLVESQAQELRTQTASLKGSFTISIEAYNGIAVSKRSLPNSASFRTIRV